MASEQLSQLFGLLSLIWWPLLLVVMYFLKRVLPPSDERNSSIRGLLYVGFFWIGRVLGTVAGQGASSTASYGIGIQEMFLLLFGLPLALLWIYIGYRKIERVTWNELGWSSPTLWRESLCGVLLGVGLFLLLEFDRVFFHAPTLRADATLLLVSFLASFGVASWQEENIYRGYLQPNLNEWIGKWKGIITQAALFSGAHIGYWQYSSLPSLLTSLALVGIMGIVLGYYRQRYSSVIAPFLAHGLVDFLPLFW